MEILRGDYLSFQSIYWGKSPEESGSFQVSLYVYIFISELIIKHISGWGGVKNSGTDGGLGLMLPESGGVQRLVWGLTTVLRYVIMAGRAPSNHLMVNLGSP